MLKVKLGRNDKCMCGSGKKYKNCCLDKTEQDQVSKYITGQSVSSDKLSKIKQQFEKLHPDNVFIDITNEMVSDEVYKQYQLHNFNSNIVMLAERTLANESVFATRINDPDSDIMFMYHGSYRTLYHGRIDYFTKSISLMISSP